MAKKEQEDVYTKEQFLASSQFTPLQKDVLHALLKDGECYTNEQVNQKIKEFNEQAVE